MWIEPKTDWVSSDYFNYSDYNRIKNNIAYLRSAALELYVDFPYSDMGDDKSGYDQFPYADEFNLMESNLESIKNNTFAFYSDDRKTWYENQRTPSYIDFNRLESACLSIYDGLQRQSKRFGALSFTLGTCASDMRV